MGTRGERRRAKSEHLHANGFVIVSFCKQNVVDYVPTDFP